MVRVLSLVWTFLFAWFVTGISFFYVRDEVKHGFPFSFARDSVTNSGEIYYAFNYWSIAFDVIIWWLLFSILWIIVKNYVLQVD